MFLIFFNWNEGLTLIACDPGFAFSWAKLSLITILSSFWHCG